MPLIGLLNKKKTSQGSIDVGRISNETDALVWSRKMFPASGIPMCTLSGRRNHVTKKDRANQQN